MSTRSRRSALAAEEAAERRWENEGGATTHELSGAEQALSIGCRRARAPGRWRGTAAWPWLPMIALALLVASASASGWAMGVGLAAGGALLLGAILAAGALTRSAGRPQAAESRGPRPGIRGVSDGWHGSSSAGWTSLTRVLLRASGRRRGDMRSECRPGGASRGLGR